MLHHIFSLKFLLTYVWEHQILKEGGIFKQMQRRKHLYGQEQNHIDMNSWLNRDKLSRRLTHIKQRNENNKLYVETFYQQSIKGSRWKTVTQILCSVLFNNDWGVFDCRKSWVLLQQLGHKKKYYTHLLLHHHGDVGSKEQLAAPYVHKEDSETLFRPNIY